MFHRELEDGSTWQELRTIAGVGGVEAEDRAYNASADVEEARDGWDILQGKDDVVHTASERGVHSDLERARSRNIEVVHMDVLADEDDTCVKQNPSGVSLGHQDAAAEGVGAFEVAGVAYAAAVEFGAGSFAVHYEQCARTENQQARNAVQQTRTALQQCKDGKFVEVAMASNPPIYVEKNGQKFAYKADSGSNGAVSPTSPIPGGNSTANGNGTSTSTGSPSPSSSNDPTKSQCNSGNSLAVGFSAVVGAVGAAIAALF
ncbi:hypothetical protein HK104_006725 [Borealophlyctis nickersoniae]|nr:hypothetical protein HK104_006725 [Borealophlyctis nickersoniae]